MQRRQPVEMEQQALMYPVELWLRAVFYGFGVVNPEFPVVTGRGDGFADPMPREAEGEELGEAAIERLCIFGGEACRMAEAAREDRVLHRVGQVDPLGIAHDQPLVAVGFGQGVGQRLTVGDELVHVAMQNPVASRAPVDVCGNEFLPPRVALRSAATVFAVPEGLIAGGDEDAVAVPDQPCDVGIGTVEENVNLPRADGAGVTRKGGDQRGRLVTKRGHSPCRRGLTRVR